MPQVSLDLISGLGVSKDSKIIDIGGGDSNLVDHLLTLGYSDITVLDISANAIERAKKRLGKNAQKVKWIVCDVLDFIPCEKYNLWHDRATFHFLTSEKDIEAYASLVDRHVDGFLVMGTFSPNGPTKCSGLEISQYDEYSLTKVFINFKDLGCSLHNHITPFGTIQNFIFCSFKNIG